MASIKSVAERFLHEIFRPSRYDQEPLLRGVYLTSGTQEGTPIDRLLGALARNFGLDQRALPSYGGHGRSYFITNLLNKVVFQERDVAGANRKFETQRRWLQRGAYAGAIGATIAAALAWSTSFTRNQVYIGRMQERVNDYQAVAEQPLMSNQIDEVLPRLEKLQGINKVYAPFKEDVPLLMGMGLYKGDTLGEAAQAAYHRDLNKIFLPRLAARLEQQLARGVGSPDFRYEALKIYLMLGQPTRLDPALVQSWMSIDWAVSYAQAPEVQGDLQKHLTNLLDAGIEPMALDERLVQDVRNELNQVPFAQLIYGRFKRDELSNDANPFRLTNAIGRQGESVFKRVSGESLDTGIPGLFTKHGFFKIYQVKSGELVNKMRDERWVLDSGRDEISQVELDKLDKDVATLYISDYIAHWDALLNDIAIVEFRDASHAAQVMDVLSAPSSPLRGLLQAVANNTALIKLPGSAGKLAEMAGQAAQEKSRLARIFSSATEGEKINTGIELPGKPIDEHFSRLNELILVESGATPPLDRLINLLSELYGHLQSIQDDAGDSSNILRKLQVEAARQPEPVKGLMQQIVSESKSVKISDLREKINAKWKNNVYPLCKAAIVDRYPVYKNATRESSLRDFGRFFGPGGVLDDFFNNNLQPYVDTAHTPWRWKGKEGAALRMPSSVLLQFQRAALIRDTFFQDGGVKPAISFGLKPKYLSARALRFTLDIDGQKFTYRHGPTQLRNAVWPGPDQRDSARVIFEDPSGAAPTLSNEGPWAWFRLLDQAAMNQLSVDRMEVTFEVGGLKATYEIRANSVVNPFAMSELQQFRCPGRL